MSEEEVAKMKKVSFLLNLLHAPPKVHHALSLSISQSLEGRRLKVFNSINVTKIKVRVLSSFRVRSTF